jgi:hypothetical protein
VSSSGCSLRDISIAPIATARLRLSRSQALTARRRSRRADWTGWQNAATLARPDSACTVETDETLFIPCFTLYLRISLSHGLPESDLLEVPFSLLAPHVL